MLVSYTLTIINGRNLLMYLLMVQLNSNLTPARGLLVEETRVTCRIHNKRARVPVNFTCVR